MIRETEEMKGKLYSPSCTHTKAVSLPTSNHKEGGKSVCASQRVERAAAQHCVFPWMYSNEASSFTCSTQGLLAEQTVKAMYSFS